MEPVHEDKFHALIWLSVWWGGGILCHGSAVVCWHTCQKATKDI